MDIVGPFLYAQGWLSWGGPAPHSYSTLPVFCCRLIALEMAKIHTIHANGSLPKPILWHKMHNYFTLVKNEINPRYKDLRGFKATTVSAALI